MYIDSIMLRNKQVPKEYAVEALKECKKIKQELIVESRDIKGHYARRDIQKRIAYYADMYRLITDYIKECESNE